MLTYYLILKNYLGTGILYNIKNPMNVHINFSSSSTVVCNPLNPFRYNK